jgi:hypothetical protein
VEVNRTKTTLPPITPWRASTLEITRLSGGRLSICCGSIAIVPSFWPGLSRVSGIRRVRSDRSESPASCRPFAIDDVALDLCHLEPGEVPERFRRRLNTVLDGVLTLFFDVPMISVTLTISVTL